MKLQEAAYTVFDVETTGLYPYAGDKICEIGAIRIEPGEPKKIYQSLINPKRAISYGAYKVNGITRDMVEGKPTIDEVIPGFLEFIKGSILVAYNAGFDLGFLDNAVSYDATIIQTISPQY